jgi:lipopolysaccharide transport system ATP-binding protein
MTAPAVRAVGLGKRYRIGQLQRYKALRDTLAEAITAPVRLLQRRREPGALDGRQTPFIWAIKDVSFDIPAGAAVGIIGRNGAGKSTLLKVLSRITEPTEGYAEVFGRVGSLLEVGTGFHPELTGRENIALNGAILGMRRREIERKFDEIVAFAEIEQFLDTPVKFYSSGMYIRLGFAVAAHLEPEVLLVDEVLAVGDAAFQQKCLGKMGEITGAGRTVLFVSHNLGAVRHLCREAIWVDQGHIRDRGPSALVVERYLSSVTTGRGEYHAEAAPAAPGRQIATLRRVSAKDENGRVTDDIPLDASVTVEIEYDLAVRVEGVRVGLRIIGSDGLVVFTSADTDSGGVGPARGPGSFVSACVIPGSLLNAGRYFVTVGCERPMLEVLFFVEHVVSFAVSLRGASSDVLPEARVGVVRPVLPWSVTYESRPVAPIGS